MTCAFLTDQERDTILQKLAEQDGLMCRFFDALQQRVYRRVQRKSLHELGDTTAWYYPAAEYLSDAAMLYNLQPEEKLAAWIRNITLDITRASIYDWVGPSFRDHAEPFIGHLETAHLCWAVAAVFDLASDVFTKEEQEKIREALFEKGITLCQRWLQKNKHLANWRGILTSGVIVAAAVLNEEEILQDYLLTLQQCVLAFQPDGSYAESLQYGNYLAFAIMLAYESLVRKYPEKAAQLDISAYAKGMTWVVNSMFYSKPMAGWGEEPRARAANFNDSAALFRPSGDLLLHIAARHEDVIESGLSRWLFDEYYTPVAYQSPHDLATFGMRNDWGFLTLPLLAIDKQAITPKDASLPLTTAFSNGNIFIRDAWDGKTIVAINGGGDVLHGPGHLHGDLNSFILVHNKERLLVDPGHSCYRNLIHGLESASQTHNTCTFLVNKDNLGLQEDLAKAILLEQQSVIARRQIIDNEVSTPIVRGNKKLTAEREDVISVVGAEVGAAYGQPIQRFARFWILAGSHVLFIIDNIKATQPVTTMWNWLVNNQDGKTSVEQTANQLIVKRKNAGLKLFHASENAHLAHPVYAYVHDAYHVEPNQLGEGKPGSGLLYRFTEKQALSERMIIHAIAMDEPAFLQPWNLITEENHYTLTNGKRKWTLQMVNKNHFSMISGHGRRWDILQEVQNYTLKRIM